MILKNKAYLVVLETRHRTEFTPKEKFEELKELVASANMQMVGHQFGKVQNPSPSHFVRSGKLQDIAREVKKLKANYLIFNVDLSPAQARNIEKYLKVKPMDRTGLILDIFGKRAKTKAGKLQVELARLTYILPRLGGLGTVMSRLGGGVGTRGPGEQEREWDRRKITGRIGRVKQELKKVKKHRKLVSDGRRKKNFITVALVGYTNAGKSTLLNTLTGSRTYVRDKLFATLDPKARLQNINGRGDILFVDTVGFLRDLPHTLVESFHATLEGVSEADVLIHVLDAAHRRVKDFKLATEKVLEEIDAVNIPTVLALNKADLLSDMQKDFIQKKWPEGIMISARDNLGVHSLLASVAQKIPEEHPSRRIKQGDIYRP